MGAVSQKFVIDVRRPSFAVLATLLAACGSEPHGDVSLQLYTVAHEEGVKRLAGTFNGALPYKANVSAEPDMGDVVELENGRFDVRLIVSN